MLGGGRGVVAVVELNGVWGSFGRRPGDATARGAGGALGPA